MYMGSIVEIAEAEALYDHAIIFTQLLISAIPMDPKLRRTVKMNFGFWSLPVSLRVVAVDLQIDVKSRKISVIKKSRNSNRLFQDIFVACHLY